MIYVCVCVLTARAVFWHSSAHILGEAMERHYGGHLCYGPPIEEGFYYDMSLESRYYIPIPHRCKCPTTHFGVIVCVYDMYVCVCECTYECVLELYQYRFLPIIPIPSGTDDSNTRYRLCG